MTREEIKKRAIQIGDDVEITSTHEEWHATVERHITEIVRATLQEAARAVCRGCCEMDYNQLTQDHRQQINDHGDFVGGPCLAIGIHDLISQLGKEGDHE